MKRVLVVDGPRETEQVLKAVLEPRGFAVCRIRAGIAEPDFAVEPSLPAVVVTHVEEDDQHEDHGASWAEIPRIVIGSAEPTAADLNRSANGHRKYLQKPFQYGELIRSIERILENAAEDDPPGKPPLQREAA